MNFALRPTGMSATESDFVDQAGRNCPQVVSHNGRLPVFDGGESGIGHEGHAITPLFLGFVHGMIRHFEHFLEFHRPTHGS